MSSNGPVLVDRCPNDVIWPHSWAINKPNKTEYYHFGLPPQSHYVEKRAYQVLCAFVVQWLMRLLERWACDNTGSVVFCPPTFIEMEHIELNHAEKLFSRVLNELKSSQVGDTLIKLFCQYVKSKGTTVNSIQDGLKLLATIKQAEALKEKEIRQQKEAEAIKAKEIRQQKEAEAIKAEAEAIKAKEIRQQKEAEAIAIKAKEIRQQKEAEAIKEQEKTKQLQLENEKLAIKEQEKTKQLQLENEKLEKLLKLEKLKQQNDNDNSNTTLEQNKQ